MHPHQTPDARDSSRGCSLPHHGRRDHISLSGSADENKNRPHDMRVRPHPQGPARRGIE